MGDRQIDQQLVEPPAGALETGVEEEGEILVLTALPGLARHDLADQQGMAGPQEAEVAGIVECGGGGAHLLAEAAFGREEV